MQQRKQIMKIHKKLYSALLLALCIVPTIQTSYKAAGHFDRWGVYVPSLRETLWLDYIAFVGMGLAASCSIVAMLIHLGKKKSKSVKNKNESVKIPNGTVLNSDALLRQVQ